jgi:flavin reductase (DIM6/NTAB) family NADH-FMN oxidoreductase RutF
MTGAKAKHAAIEPRLFRSVMGRFATGMTVVSSTLDGRVYCMTANAFMSGSLEPPLCVIAVGCNTRMHAVLTQARHFGVSVLADDHEKYSRHFGGRPIDKLQAAFEHVDETPLLADRLAGIAARVTDTYPCGDHSLFVGGIFYMNAKAHGKPLVFYGGHYAVLVRRPGLDVPIPEFW